MSYTDVTVLNVGAGSCTVVEHAGSAHVTMVDVNDGTDQRSYEVTASEQPLTDPIEWCRRVYGTSVFRFVLSHPDADHMAGLRRILVGEELDVQNFWDLPHTRTRAKKEFQSTEAWRDWLAYEAMRDDTTLEGITWPRRISPMRNEQGDYWSADNIQVLSPTPALVSAADQADSYNDASYVLRFTHASSSVLLASDVEEPAWRDMFDNDVRLRANVLIASHHGRKSGFSADAMELIRPEVVVVSTAKLPAAHDGISEYKRVCDDVLSTRIDGNTTIRMHDNGELVVFDESGAELVHLYDQ